jgi:tetratricopeptide (TPR) repeat protein
MFCAMRPLVCRLLFAALLMISSSVGVAFAQADPEPPDEAEADDSGADESGASAEATVVGETQAVNVEAHLDNAARELFMAGRAAYEAGRYEEALTQFQRAHSLSGRNELLFNIGQSFDRLRRDADAIEAFERYLQTEPAQDERVAIEARLAILRRHVQEASPPDAVVPGPGVPGPVDTDPRTDLDTDTVLAEPPPPSRSNVGLIVGIVAAVVVVGLGVGLAIGLSNRSPDQQAGDSGNVHFALGSW